MRTRHWIGTALCLGALAAAGTAALQQDKKPIPAASPEEAAMMAKWAEFATPGPAHKVLETKIGKWSGTVKMFMPGAPAPHESKFTSEAKWIMDGRYVEETVVGETPMGPFNGKGTTGYDNIKKKYVSTWVDNNGTGIHFSEGTYDPATKTFTFSGECPDSMMSKYVQGGRMVDKMIDNDHGTAQAFGPGPDGKETIRMEITYTRAK